MASNSSVFRKGTRYSSLVLSRKHRVSRLPGFQRRFFAASSDTKSDRVVTEIDASTGVCRVQLARPDKLNAFDMAMFEAVAETATRLKDDRSIRAVIMSGQGRAFSTGLDVKNVLKDGNPQKKIRQLIDRRSRSCAVQGDVGGDGQTPAGTSRTITSNLAQDVSILWRELNVPVIAVLQGMCYGAGFQVALGADFRYSTPDCKLSIMEGKWGLIPDMGASIFLPELVRIDVAKELTMTGRIISGSEAANLGLVTRVCDDPMAEAELFAAQLVERSPDAIAAGKKLFQRTWTASDEESLRLETKLQEGLLVSWNQLAASGRSALGWDVPYIKRK
mmetsp:Transcript_32794/g.77338  ORF Transcript_32794/g.77338 Transcript_32794/m.77338 type:complete len:333 (-) Transcript_32794:1214-2212(-)